MIAGRHRDHAALSFVRRQRQQAIERAALLEGRGELQVLEFEPEIAAADLAQRPALVAFGDDDGTADRGRRGRDVAWHDGKRSVLVRRGVFGGFRHFGSLVERQSYKPFPPDAPPPNLVKLPPHEHGCRKKPLRRYTWPRAAGTGGRSFHMNSLNDAPKAEAITVVLVEDDAPTLW